MLAPGTNTVNSPKRLSASFRDDSGNGYDPTTVTFKTVDPWGNTASYVYGTDTNVLRTDAGDYTADITPDKAGRWYIRWETVGGVIAIEDQFLVQTSRFSSCDGWPDSFSDIYYS